jgi:type II secretion system protein L
MNLLRLFVPEHWNPDQSNPAEWYWVSNTGLKGESLDRGLPTGFKTQVFLPAADVLMLDIDLPRKSRWREAIPFAIEEYLLGDLANAHIAVDTQSVHPKTRVYVMDRHWLKQLLDFLKLRGIQIDGLYSPSAILSDPNQWTALMSGHEGSLILQNGFSHTLDSGAIDHPPAMLKKILDEQDKSQRPSHLRIICNVDNLEQLARLSVTWSEILGIRCTIERDFKTQALRSLTPYATNLLSGEFAQESKATWHKLDRQFKLALTLLAISVMIWVLGYAVETWLWGNQVRQLKVQAETELRRGFPDTRSILDPDLQMQRGLANLRAQAGYYAPDELPALLSRLKELGELDYAHLISLDYQNQNAILVWHCDSAGQAQMLLTRLREMGMQGTLKPDSTGQNVILRLGQAAS